MILTNLADLSDEQLYKLLQSLPEDKLFKLVESLPEGQREFFYQSADEYFASVTREKAQSGFMSFVKEMWPGFISGRHHAVMAKAFERVAKGELKRLIINMPPRHTKSEFASYLLPAWFLGNFPQKKIIQCSNTAELAVGFGRKVRNLVDSENYAQVFPNVALRHDSKAAGRWSTNESGEYFAIGVGGTVTGKGADLLIIDDPHSEQEATLAETSPEIYDKVYEWFTSGPRQRLQPGGSIIVVMCMTGDTRVLMASGDEKDLKDIRAGDEVATFDNGRITTSRVNNWRSSGVDVVYKVQTQSGTILRANERHPFLVMNEGVLEWTRLNQLQVGDLLVSLKGASDHQGQKQSQECAAHVWQKSHTTEKIQMRRESRSGTTANGKALSAALKIAQMLQQAVAYALSTMANSIYPSHHRMPTASAVSSIDMALLLNSTKRWLQNVRTDVMFAAKSLLPQTRVHIGVASCASTIAMTQEKYEDFCATTATLQSDMAKRQAYLSELHRISDFTVDQIVSITPDGKEEVFDVEIDRTENFIANGVVSHNTRWSKRDLTGQVLKAAAQRGGDEWEVIEFPAILPSDNPLWPEFWSRKELQALKDELPNAKWMAQYQQQPTSESSALIKREWWKEWESEHPPACDFILIAADTAYEAHNRADYSAFTVWGIFDNPDSRGVYKPNLILLHAERDRLEFPDLKRKTLQLYREWDPDAVIIEKKASGAPLIYELRSMGIPVQEFTPVRGNDKISRLNAVSDIFASGMVWAPNTSWAEQVIDEVASFPAGEHDDYVDTVSLALMRFRRGGFIRTDLDEEEEPVFQRKREYY